MAKLCFCDRPTVFKTAIVDPFRSRLVLQKHIFRSVLAQTLRQSKTRDRSTDDHGENEKDRACPRQVIIPDTWKEFPAGFSSNLRHNTDICKTDTESRSNQAMSDVTTRPESSLDSCRRFRI